VGFKPAVPTSEGPHADVLDLAATGMGNFITFTHENTEYFSSIRILSASYNSHIKGCPLP
jgi:hypothetical protein